MSSDPCNHMDTGVETIKRQTGAAYGCMVDGQKVRWRGLNLRHDRSVCDTTATLQLQLQLVAPCKCYAFLPLPFNSATCYMLFNAYTCN